MACIKCEERRRKLRDAILAGKIAEAAGHVVAGVKEMLTDDEPEAQAKVTKAK